MTSTSIKLTPTRKAVLDILTSEDAPIGAYSILDRLKETKSNAVPMTVYRALDYLTDNRLIHKVENLNAYIACSHPDHHHICQLIICEECQNVLESCDKELAKLVEEKATSAGFKISKAILEITAICSSCQQKELKSVS